MHLPFAQLRLSATTEVLPVLLVERYMAAGAVWCTSVSLIKAEKNNMIDTVQNQRAASTIVSRSF